MNTVGADGQRLLTEIDDSGTLQGLANLAEIETLRTVWEQWYVENPSGGLRARPKRDA